MTDVAAAEERVPRDDNSDVMTSSLPMSCDLVVKVEVADDAEDVGNGQDPGAAEQHRPDSPDRAAQRTSLVSVDDKVETASEWPGAGQTSTETTVNQNVHERLHQALDDAVDGDYPSDVASAAAAAAVLVDSRLTCEQTWPAADDMTDEQNTSLVISAKRGDVGHCRVCGDEATGMYFGALVCVPCKVNRNFDLSLIIVVYCTLCKVYLMSLPFACGNAFDCI